jgi:hypothetical protein
MPANDLGIYWDNVLVEQTDQLRPYFDGSTIDERGWDFAWTGTANASTSTAACASTEVARNLVPNPSMVTSDGVFTTRKNLITDPRATSAFTGYGTQTITPVSISGHPMGITTANRVAYTSGASNPGVTLYTPSANTQYTISAWVYHETAPTAGSQAFAQAGVISQPSPPAIVAGQWQRLSWTQSVGATATPIGFRIGSPVGDGSFLITGIMVETAPIMDDYFDGSAPAALRTNLIPNPTGNTTSGWFGAGSAPGTVTGGLSGGPVGTNFARLQVTGTATGTNYFALAHGSTTSSIWAPVTAGLTYTASAYIRVTMANFTQQPKFRLRWKLASGTTISDEPIVSAVGSTSGQWVRLSATGTAPAGAVYAELMCGYISLDQTTITVGDTVDVSAALIEQTSTLGAYFDGNTTTSPGVSYGWRGSANTSVSYAYSSDLSYVWDGAANSSASSQRGNSVTDYVRSGSDTGNPQIVTDGGAKVLRYIYRSEANPIAVNISSLSSNSSMAGKTYTITAKIRSSFTVNGARLRLGGLDGTGFNLTANQWQTVSLTGVYPATGYTSALWAPAAGAGNYGKYIDVADVSVVEGVYKGNFFNGSTPASGDFSYSWTGATHNSASFKKAPRPLNVIASKSSAVTGAYFHAISAMENGERYARFISPAGTDNSNWRIPMSSGLDYASIVAGNQYTIYVKYRMSGWPTASTVTFGLKDPQSTNAVMSDSNISVTQGSGWQTFSKTFTAMINGLQTTNLYIVIPSIPPTDQDGIFDIAEWYLVEGNYAGPVFDGSTPAAGDYTYAWQGVADNSASYTVGTLVQGASTGNTKVHQSSYWSRKGKSLRMIPLDVGGSTATSVALPVTLTPGKTYTVLGTRYLDKPLTGTLNSAYGGKIALIQPGLSTLDSGTALPNVPGEGTIRWTFTVDPAATGQTLRLGHGGGPNSGEVWWDDVLVVEGAYTGPYFDGTRPAYENLVITPATAATGSTTHATGVSYAGSTWTRSSVSTNGVSLTRQYVDLNSLILGETYTTAVTLANDQAFSQTVSFDWCDTGSVTHTLAPGEVKRIVTSGSRAATGQYQYSSVYRFADIQVTSSSTESRSILFKDWIVERGVTSGDYYAGKGDFGYSWSGTANSSTSVQTAPGLWGWSFATNAQVYQSSAYPTKSGMPRCAGVSTRGASGDGIYSQDIGVSANTVYTFSAWVKTQYAHRLDGVLRWKDINSNTIFDYTYEVSPSITVGQWSRVSISGTSPANTVKVQPMWRIYAAHTPTTFYVDGANLNEGLDPTFFDGSTQATTDFTYAWTGAVNLSSSTENAKKVVGMTGNYSNRAAYQSTAWSASGSNSLAIVSGSRPNVDTFSQWETHPLNGVNVGGKTYTFMGRLRTLEPFPVGADGRAWSIHATYNKSGGGTGSISCKPITTGAGFHEVRQTVTFPSDATTVPFMRLYNGSPNNSPVYWDNIMIVEGTYTGDFLNPDQNPLAKWTGTVNQSTSFGYPPQLLDIAGKPEADITTIGHTVLNPIGWSEQEGRTLYTVFTNLQTIPSGGPVSVIANYGDDAFTDNVPNSFLTLRQQRYADTGNSIINRRTGGGGVQSFPANLGSHVAVWGISGAGLMFVSIDNKPRINDSVVMSIPNEKIVISSDNAYNSHIRTLLYRGDHDDATRIAISRYLGNKYGASVA